VTIGADACRVALGYWLDRVVAGDDVIVTRRGKPLVRLTAIAPTSAPAPCGPALAPVLRSITAEESA